jgi:tripeptidyl-peptidase-1
MQFSSLRVFALALAAVHLCAASPLAKRFDDFSVKHAWNEVPRGWEFHSDAPADHRFDLKIALKQDKFDELIRHLYEVSDPVHERYVFAHA